MEPAGRLMVNTQSLVMKDLMRDSVNFRLFKKNSVYYEIASFSVLIFIDWDIFITVKETK